VKDIIFFSHNDNKIREVLSLFKKTKINIVSLENFPNLSEPKENGSTFEENAKIKSSYGYAKFKFPCFADDSGICISALNNLPGIKSKRFLQRKESLEKILKNIIQKTKDRLDRKAYFQTSISLTFKDKSIIFTGLVKGEISSEPRGQYGFHYDPIFIPNGFKKTYGEMSLKEKNEISHRAIAIRKLKKYLLKLFS